MKAFNYTTLQKPRVFIVMKIWPERIQAWSKKYNLLQLWGTWTKSCIWKQLLK